MPAPRAVFSYTDEEVRALELALSAERFQFYLQRAGSSRLRAIRLYERNTALSESLYGVGQATEVALRNAIHRILSDAVSPMWFYRIDLHENQLDKVNRAKFDLEQNRKSVTPGALVAELRLGFWTSLISTRYENLLWRPHLHKAFPNAWDERPDGVGGISRTKKKRPDIFLQLERIRILRNRIAHHEPIIKLDLPRSYFETVQALHWVCSVSSLWVKSTSSFVERFRENAASIPAPLRTPVATAPIPGSPQ